ncbi:hypothetical protein [Sphingomonas spermidinifaciens]|uniref:hypothetical protein n=1 Tax=Sphingomonas spermidinifaciens TaxID=1141889 RepID=UPI001142DA54|nr:hypothetical protein [Sphingomonas spermidinifaciens]
MFTGVDLTATPKKITDLDVLGISLREDGTVGKSIFDCKSAGGPAFARALWLSGLMRYVGAREGIIIMGKPAEPAHRLAARKLDVTIFGSGAFDSYAAATNPEYRVLQSYAGNLENWHRINDAALKQPAVAEILLAIQQEVPLCTDPARAFRRFISRLLQHKGELNPAKPLHMAAFVECVVGFSYLFLLMVQDLRLVIDLAIGEKEFSTFLRYYLWGGPEGVANLRRMYELLAAHEGTSEQGISLVLWPQLIQLVRGLLEAPTQVHNCVIALRELSLRQMANIDSASDLRAGKLFLTPRARQFAKRIGFYAAGVMKLPSEFAERMDQQIDGLVSAVR